MSERKIQVQLETLTKEQAGTIDQLKEAQSQVTLSQQEITEVCPGHQQPLKHINMYCA